MQSLSGLTLSEIEDFVHKQGLPAFRGRQIHSWIYDKNASNIEDMSNLPAALRTTLAKQIKIPLLSMQHLQVSKDGTRKYLFASADGQMVESVLMRFADRKNITACISSQVGCAVGCTFCATGYLGFKRNLTSQEIVDQLMCMQRESGLRIGNVVFMGQGEPLL